MKLTWKKMGFDNWIGLAQDRVKWQVFMLMAMDSCKREFPLLVGNC
jgi:hypothetical protein